MTTIAFHPAYVGEKDSFHRSCSIYGSKVRYLFQNDTELYRIVVIKKEEN